jgi:hypothetical protein
MSHVRQQIRERVASTLTGLSTTGNNVFQSRVYPLNESVLPALLIYSKNEDSEITTIGTSLGIERNLIITIEAYVKVTTNFDDLIDTICAEIETALGNDIKLNNLAKFSYLQSTEIQYDGDGENPIGYATLNYFVQYRTGQNTPETAE